jgi:hypothetical protein
VPKTIAVLGSALFFAVAPSSVAGLVPWWITHWEFRPPFFDLEATRAVGILLIVAGLPGLVDSFARFALQGLGTPAPIAPTQNGPTESPLPSRCTRLTPLQIARLWSDRMPFERAIVIAGWMLDRGLFVSHGGGPSGGGR